LIAPHKEKAVKEPLEEANAEKLVKTPRKRLI
jgi:hypothetical protein